MVPPQGEKVCHHLFFKKKKKVLFQGLYDPDNNFSPQEKTDKKYLVQHSFCIPCLSTHSYQAGLQQQMLWSSQLLS